MAGLLAGVAVVAGATAPAAGGRVPVLGAALVGLLGTAMLSGRRVGIARGLVRGGAAELVPAAARRALVLSWAILCWRMASGEVGRGGAWASELREPKRAAPKISNSAGMWR